MLAISCSIAQARHDLANLVHKAETGGHIQLTRYGKPVAVIVSKNEFERVHKKQQNFWTALQVFNKVFSDVMIDEDIFSNLREKSPGRSSPWK